MKNYYILTVDSFQDTFTRIDAGKDFYFELSVQNITGILSVLQGGDTVIVYRKSPVSGCTIVLQVVENAGNKTKFRKVFEIGNVVNPSVPDHDLENEYLVEISSDVYGVICKQMLDSIQGIMEVNISEEEHQNNLKQRFEQYILHVLKLKSTRQVGDLEKLSDRLVANGVLERGVYQIDNIDDYTNTLEKIRESEEYITYKSERKEKNNSLQNDQMITIIHEYCVYESFDKMGWLFTNSMPQKPRIKFNYRMFKGILMDKIASTFNDNNKMLFRNLLAIIDYTGSGFSTKKFQYGTYRFEYIWESLVDKVYGISGKEEFFPKTYWNIDKNVVPNACLEPDTIMLCNNDVYVLDAKYYKYGATKRAVDLPESTSINKQITYGEYIDEQKKFRQKYGDNMKVYNAFLMPFNSKSDKWMTEDKVIRIGQAYGDWKTNLKSYEKVQGIVVDIKFLMKLSSRQNEEEIRVLADKIAKYVNEEV